MRKIKFRGIKYDKTGWMYGSLLEDVILDGIEEINSEYISISKWYSVLTPTIGQYIGLNDINGIEIFEGDILEIYSYPFISGGIHNYYGIVCYDNNSLDFYIVALKANDSIISENCEGKKFSLYETIICSDVKVIGSIHDEILNEGVLEND